VTEVVTPAIAQQLTMIPMVRRRAWWRWLVELVSGDLSVVLWIVRVVAFAALVFLIWKVGEEFVRNRREGKELEPD